MPDGEDSSFISDLPLHGDFALASRRFPKIQAGVFRSSMRCMQPRIRLPIDMSCQFSYDTDDPPPLGPKGTFSLYKKLFSIQCTDENCKTPVVILAPKRENYHQLDLEAEMFQWKFADGI